MAFYSESQRQLQDRFESRQLADTLEERIVNDHIDELTRPFVETRDFFFLSTVNSNGEPTVSYKGGDVGFIRVVDPQTLAFPMYDGNGMFLSAGNIADTAKIGMLFIDFETPHRIRVQATASVDPDDPLMGEYPGALLVVRAKIDQAFFNCARYIHTHTRVATSPYVPDEDGEQPFPAWKRLDAVQGSLPPEARERTEAEGGPITEDEYAVRLLTGES